MPAAVDISTYAPMDELGEEDWMSMLRFRAKHSKLSSLVARNRYVIRFNVSSGYSTSLGSDATLEEQ